MRDDLLKRLRSFPMTTELTNIYVGDGWFELVKDCIVSIEEYCCEKNLPIPKAVQIKNKFGGLRFYIENDIDGVYSEQDFEQIHRFISIAESKAYKTCSKCGKSKKMDSDRMVHSVRSACKECNE